MTIPFSAITVPPRYRKDYGDLRSLTASISHVGLLHPLVLSREAEETFLLVAGGRRYAALKSLGCAALFHGSTLQPNAPGFVFADEVPEDQRKEAELHENMYRLATKWTEDVLLVADIHAQKRQTLGTGEWGLEETAELLGEGYGRTSVSLSVNIAKMIRAGDGEIAACENMKEAIRLLTKRREDAAISIQQKRNAAKFSTSSFLDSLNLNTKEKITPIICQTTDGTGTTILLVPEAPPKISVPLSSMFLLGDMQIVHFPPCDHIVTDIPYGIDMDNLENVEDVSAEHDVQDNLSLMPVFLAKAYASVRSGGFCVFFYDLDHHEKLQTMAKAVGWKVQRWPYVACKTSSCRNGAAAYNTTKNYEVCMFLRKDEKTVLRKQIPTSWGSFDFAIERDLYNNPFAKPAALWRTIYDAVAFPGQSVLDPFCGEMSACRAAVNAGLIPLGIEKKEQHFNRGLVHMRNVYSLVHKGNVQFT